LQSVVSLFRCFTTPQATDFVEVFEKQRFSAALFHAVSPAIAQTSRFYGLQSRVLSLRPSSLQLDDRHLLLRPSDRGIEPPGAKGSPDHPFDGRDMWKTLAEGAPSPNEDVLIDVEAFRGAVPARAIGSS